MSTGRHRAERHGGPSDTFLSSATSTPPSPSPCGRWSRWACTPSSVSCGAPAPRPVVGHWRPSRAWAGGGPPRPRLILLDEPFNGLDQPNRDALLSIITDLKDQGISLVISTHDLVLAQETCEQAALLAGRQIAFGPRDDVLVARYIDEAYGGHGTTRLLGLRSGAGTQEPS